METQTKGWPGKTDLVLKVLCVFVVVVVVVVVVVRTGVYDDRVCPGTPTLAPNYGGR